MSEITNQRFGHCGDLCDGKSPIVRTMPSRPGSFNDRPSAGNRCSLARAPMGHFRIEEMEVRVPGLKSCSSGKKPYHRPACTQKSISEAGALLRKKIADHENTLGTGGVSAPVDRLILLVEGYEGDLRFIGQTARTPTRQLEPFSILKGEGLVEMQFVDGQGAASPETFLLLDLRDRHNGGRGLLESIGGDPNLSDAVPLVILVTSMELFHGWRGVAPEHCWQLRGRPSPAVLATALRSFLHLCSTLATWPPEERPALDKAQQICFDQQS